MAAAPGSTSIGTPTGRCARGTTARGWEAEFAIPLKTLRYNPGDERTWGVNAMRNIRRKNEQVFLSPVPRGYNLYRVSVAGKVERACAAGPARPEVHPVRRRRGQRRQDAAHRHRSAETRDVGLDIKWGVRADLTLDLTVNTDFAQVEADEQQVNLTRFPLFFAEKRPFFLENAQLFQLGQPQAIDLFFSRRIGLLAQPASRSTSSAAARLSGKLGGYNVGLLNMQTDSPPSIPRTGADRGSRQQLHACCGCSARSGDRTSARCIVGRQGVGARAADDDYNRAYGVDLGWQATTQRPGVRVSRAHGFAGEQGRLRLRRPRLVHLHHPSWTAGGGYAQVGDASILKSASFAAAPSAPPKADSI